MSVVVQESLSTANKTFIRLLLDTYKRPTHCTGWMRTLRSQPTNKQEIPGSLHSQASSSQPASTQPKESKTEKSRQMSFELVCARTTNRLIFRAGSFVQQATSFDSTRTSLGHQRRLGALSVCRTTHRGPLERKMKRRSQEKRLHPGPHGLGT